MTTRFTDDLSNNTDGSDFIVRQRIPLALQIFIIFAVAFIAIYVTASIMNDRGSKTLFFLTLTLTIGSLTWFTIYFSARLRDLVLATEFQNAMLASAAQLSTRFCLITKRDGTIVYFDPGFQKLFPHFMQTADRNIDGLLANAGITQDIIQKIFLIFQENKNERVLLSLRKEGGEPVPLMMSIDMLPRPRGYFLLRGRDYVEKRNTDTAKTAQPMLAEAPLALALNTLPQGMLIADGGGSVIFVNNALEHWLGFKPGEMLNRPLKTGHVIYQYSGMDAGRLVSGDFAGEAVLLRKDRSLVNAHIRQTSHGKTAGMSVVVSAPQSVVKK